MIRLFNVHYPKNTILLTASEAFVLFASFLVAAILFVGSNVSEFLQTQHGLYKILAVTLATQFYMYIFDMYDMGSQSVKESRYRLLWILSTFSLLLGMLGYLLPNILLGRGATVAGLFVVSIALFVWRTNYRSLLRKVDRRRNVFMLGQGEGGQRVARTIETRPALNMRLVGSISMPNPLDAGTLVQQLITLARNHELDEVIVALPERRAVMPVQELLQLRLCGVTIQDCTAVLERISGKIEVDNLYPSWLIFSDGFHILSKEGLLRRAIMTTVWFALVVLTIPLVPLIALAIKLDSPGPVLYRQKRVGLGGRTFDCYKFRTMRADAEADTGPTWAGDDDPRITAVGRWLRRSRLDEVPQLWNTLRGDMDLCGPRPERPEFVERLGREIPYYQLRHVVRPGITGWAQVNYPYGNTVEDAKEKLSYDLFYIKNYSLGLDLTILGRTLKIVLLGRGAK